MTLLVHCLILMASVKCSFEAARARARHKCRERGIQGTTTVARSVSTVFFEFANSFDQSQSNSEKLIAIIN